MVKTDKYLFERYGGMFIGILSFVVSFFVFKPIYNGCWEYLLSKSFDLGIGTFGFLLAVLALIVQGDSQAIKLIKSRGILYKRLILFNKRVVFISISICFYSVIAKLVNEGVLIGTSEWIQNIILSLFLLLLTWFIVDTFRFLKIFYSIIME